MAEHAMPGGTPAENTLPDPEGRAFYRAFENRFRGARDDIKSRLRVYLPFIEGVKTFDPQPTALDLGCGRGEWLELMRESGVDAEGVDLDEGMLADCRTAGLAARRADVLDVLRELPDASRSIVSAFHLVEHLPFERLQELVREALRVLRPGGLLILETPNPENLSVGANTFYLDPTHSRPIPPALLAFLPEYHGFARTAILRLQERAGMAGSGSPTLLNVLRDASADYAVVAQKAGTEEQATALAPAFEKPYGVKLEELANAYDASFDARMMESQARAANADSIAREAQATAHQAQALAQQAEALAQQADALAHDAQSNVEQLLASKSWRWTAPLRTMAGAIKALLGKIERERRG